LTTIRVTSSWGLSSPRKPSRSAMRRSPISVADREAFGSSPRVLRHVRHEHDLARQSRRPDDAFARLQPELPALLDLVTLDVGRDQEALLVGHEDVEDPVVYDAPQLLGDRGEQLVGVEDAVDFSDEREQVGEQLAGQRRAAKGAGGARHGAC
jgi:hypothetical protein